MVSDKGSWWVQWHTEADFSRDGIVVLHRDSGMKVEHRLSCEWVDALSEGSVSWDQLFPQDAGSGVMPRPMRIRIRRLLERGFLQVKLSFDDGSWVCWQDAERFERKVETSGTAWRRRAGTHVRWEADQCIVESPGIRSRILTRNAAMLSDLMHCLHTGSDPNPAGERSVALRTLLVSAGMLVRDSHEQPEVAPAEGLDELAAWHERVFHSKWRLGGDASPVGALFPGYLAGREPPAVFPEEEAEEGVELLRADRNSLPQIQFCDVLAKRRSIRASGAAMTLEQLGHFLDLVHHPQEEHCQRVGEQQLPTLWRPTAAGGSLHELDLFLNLNAVEGMAPGLYYYASSRHVLVPVPMSDADRNAMRREAEAASHYDGSANVQILIFSRLQRLLWKYESMAYAITLQNTGALKQTLYLVATCLGLAPCAIGNGNERWLRSCPSLSSTKRWWVGNFLLSSGFTAQRGKGN